MGSPTSTPSSPTQRNPHLTSRSPSERESTATSSSESSIGSETDPGPRLPRRIAPFDLGDGKDEVTRALELNRKLLLVSKQEPLVDAPAVRAKIDELLGQLLELD